MVQGLVRLTLLAVLLLSGSAFSAGGVTAQPDSNSTASSVSRTSP